jgi:hypothetical protein
MIGAIGMGPSCVGTAVRSVKVLDSGTYGLNCNACATKLRKLVSLDPTVAKRAAYTSTFAGDAVGCKNEGTNYVSKLSGYFIPSLSGAYTFSLAASEGGELWLSTQESSTLASNLQLLVNATASTAEARNLAYQQAAAQSSMGWGGSAYKAVDGNTNTDYAEGSVTHTNSRAGDQWWRVDLGSSHPIDAVEIWNR